MDFFSCNNCKRYRRRTSSSGEEDNDDATVPVRQRTTLRRGSGSSGSGCGRISLCCATAVMYCYAASRVRRDGRSRSSKTNSNSRKVTVGNWSSADEMAAVNCLELPQLHQPSSPKIRTPSSSLTRGSILKNSLLSEFAASAHSENAGLCATATDTNIPDIRRSSSPEKRTSFNEAVDVIVADERGRQVVADSVRLKPPSADDDDDSENESERKRRHRTDGESNTTSFGFGSGQGRKVGNANSRRKHHPAYVYPPASRCRHAFSLASADVERRPDGSRYLRAVIRPASSGARQNDRDCDTTASSSVKGSSDSQTGRRLLPQPVANTAIGSERVVVRAGAKGSRLVVGAYRPEPLGDGTNYLRQYIDRFPLPHVIETQSIKADMQPTGVLVITAAINESSDTDTD